MTDSVKTPRPKRSTINRQPRIRVLVTDDDEMHRAVLDSLPINIRRRMDVYGSASLGETITKLSTPNHGIDIHLLDLNLGETNGLETWRILQQHVERRVMPPTIVLSGEDPDEFQASLIEAGVVNYLTKDTPPLAVYRLMCDVLLSDRTKYRYVTPPDETDVRDRVERAKNAYDTMPPPAAHAEAEKASLSALEVLMRGQERIESKQDAQGLELSKTRRDTAQNHGLLIGLGAQVKSNTKRVTRAEGRIDGLEDELEITQRSSLVSTHELEKQVLEKDRELEVTKAADQTGLVKAKLSYKQKWIGGILGIIAALISAIAGASGIAEFFSR